MKPRRPKSHPWKAIAHPWAFRAWLRRNQIACLKANLAQKPVRKSPL